MVDNAIPYHICCNTFHFKKHIIKLLSLLDSATKFDAATGNHIAILQDVYSISPIS